MNITLQLPDNELLEAALRYNPIRDGYPSTEDWCVGLILGAVASEETDLAELDRTWFEDMKARKLAG
jgi:hypothetical protein